MAQRFAISRVSLVHSVVRRSESFASPLRLRCIFVDTDYDAATAAAFHCALSLAFADAPLCALAAANELVAVHGFARYAQPATVTALVARLRRLRCCCVQQRWLSIVAND